MNNLLRFNQTLSHPFPASKVFPLLCPVRESQWLQGWKAEVIHSLSGFIEQDAVFITPHKSGSMTMWTVTNYDPEAFKLSFVRATDNVEVVMLDIELEDNGESCKAQVEYRFVPFADGRKYHLEQSLPTKFPAMMDWWEKALNHYLATGMMLKEK